MALITTTGSGSWSSTTPDAPWPGGTKPVAADTVEIAAGHTVTLDEDTAVLGANGIKNVAGSNTSVLAISGTRVINSNVSYSGTATTGFVTIGAAADLTINGAVTAIAAGYCVVTASSGILRIANGTNTASENTSSGRGVSHSGTGLLSITGNVLCSGSGYGVYNSSSSVSHVLNGSLVASGAGVNSYRLSGGTLAWTPGATGVTQSGTSSTTSGMYVTGGTCNILAKLVTANTSSVLAIPVYVLGGTVTYLGSYALAASENCEVRLVAGSLLLATASDHLVLANSGTFVVTYQSGTFTTTNGAHTASIVNQTTTSYAAIIGGTDANKAIITGPTLPFVAARRNTLIGR